MELIVNSARNILSSNEIPVCAAIANGNEIISVSNNKVEGLNSAVMHAEYVVVTESLKALKAKYLNESSVYITMEPCAFCAACLERVRIKNIFFGAYSVKTGAIYHGCKVFEHSIHKPNIIGGIMEKECSDILRLFFQKGV
jgi:tRNA(Arg) A34 adenosine deaminase TadA